MRCSGEAAFLRLSGLAFQLAHNAAQPHQIDVIKRLASNDLKTLEKAGNPIHEMRRAVQVAQVLQACAGGGDEGARQSQLFRRVISTSFSLRLVYGFDQRMDALRRNNEGHALGVP